MQGPGLKKSGEGNLVWVRVPPPALCKSPANVGVLLVGTQRPIFTSPRLSRWETPPSPSLKLLELYVSAVGELELPR